MDEQLAAIYGTGASDVTEDDMEKAAAAELLVKLAEEEGVDLNDFSDEEIGEMVNELYGSGEGDDEAQEKLAEADFLGRVMAHAYVQEMGEIEKSAAKTFAERAGSWTTRQLGGLHEAGEGLRHLIKPRGGKVAKGYRADVMADMLEAAKGKKGRMSALAKAMEASERGIGARRLWGGLKRSKGIIGAGAGLAGLAGLAGYGGYKALKKESSALDTLANERAMQMLYDNGWIDDQGNLLHEPAQEKTALDTAVETRALQILEANGFPVTWNK